MSNLALVPRNRADDGAVFGAALAPVYQGPERRSAPAWPWSARMLDEIDYGVLVVDAGCRLLHANRVAWARLRRAGCPVALADGRLHCAVADDGLKLDAAVHAAATRGLRRLVNVGRGAAALGIAFVPLPADGLLPAPVLLLVSRAHVCEPLSAEWFARSHGLTAAESRVLHSLCSGARPTEMAAEFGVALSTVRTQIGTLRAKTGSSSIKDLVRRVARLPPMVNVVAV